MTTMETSDLHTRVARYETVVNELRAAHQDVRSVLQDQVLYARWQQIGADLGFTSGHDGTPEGQPDMHAMSQQIPQMSDSWAS